MKAYAKLLLGLLTVAGFAVSLVMSSGAASATTTTVAVGDIYFCGAAYEGDVCTTTISVGDTVVWDFSAAEVAHTVTECGASCSSPASSSLFDSGVVQDGGDSFQFTFTTAGRYNYYCQIHALMQQGEVVVQQASPATPTVAPGTTPAPTSSGGGGLPPTGYGPQAHDSSQWWSFGALAILGVTLVSFSALGFVRSRKV